MLSEKKLKRIKRELGELTKELDEMNVHDLKQRIAASCANIKDGVDQLEANPKFQELKENLKAISEGLREVKKRQNAIIQYSLHLIEE